VVAADGSIVIGGTYYNYSSSSAAVYAAARFTGNGALDATFGDSGIAVADYPNDYAGQFDLGSAVAVQPDGKVIVGGQINWYFGPAALVRFNGNGTLDTSFGAGGWAIGGIIPGELAVRPDGKIVSGGSSYSSNAD